MIKTLLKLAVVSFCTLTSLSAYAGPYEDGMTAFEAYDFDKAFSLFRTSAEQGNLSGQSYLAHMYFTGKGVEKSYPEAVKWYKKSAKQGHVSSQKQMALMYSSGKYGLEQSDAQALHWYKKAAEQGDTAAMFNIGIIYKDGIGVAPSKETAVSWFRKCAATDHGNYGTCSQMLGKMGVK